MYSCRLVVGELPWVLVPAPINIILFCIKRESFTEELSLKASPNNYSMVIRAISWEKDDMDSSHPGCEREINLTLPQLGVVSRKLMSKGFLSNYLINNV